MAGRERTVIGPNSFALEALRYAEFTEPKSLTKPNGQEIRTRLVIEGAGMVGLSDRVENKEWAGMFNHYMKVGGGYLQLARLLQLNGHQVDLQLAVNTTTLSHNGRRQLDEANWYPQEVTNAAEKQKMGDTKIGLENMRRLNLPAELIRAVSVHEIGGIFPFEDTKTWNEILPMYLDFRISQDAMTKEDRFRDLERGIAAGRFTREWHTQALEWTTKHEQGLFEALHLASYQEVASSPEHLRTRVDTAIKLGRFSEEETQVLKDTKLYKPKSGKDIDPAEAARLAQDEFLEKLQLHPEDINERLLQPERWERYIRRLYINDAEEAIFGRLTQLNKVLASEEEYGSMTVIEMILNRIKEEFPSNSWWGKYVNKLYQASNRQPYNPKTKPVGIQRAIEFYRKIEQRQQAREEKTT